MPLRIFLPAIIIFTSSMMRFFRIIEGDILIPLFYCCFYG